MIPIEWAAAGAGALAMMGYVVGRLIERMDWLRRPPPAKGADGAAPTRRRACDCLKARFWPGYVCDCLRRGPPPMGFRRRPDRGF